MIKLEMDIKLNYVTSGHTWRFSFRKPQSGNLSALVFSGLTGDAESRSNEGSMQTCGPC